MVLESFPEERSQDWEDFLENQQENHEKHPIQELVCQKRLSLERSYQCDEFRRNFSQCSLLVQHQGDRLHNCGSLKNFKNSDVIKQGKSCAGKKPWKCNECEESLQLLLRFCLASDNSHRRKAL